MSERYYKAMGSLLTLLTVARWVAIIGSLALFIYFFL